jgi:hypothetical protein
VTSSTLLLDRGHALTVASARRTAKFDVISAWNALVSSTSPASVLTHPRLRAAREEVNAEVGRCSRTPPTFTPDGRVALIRIHSAAQVHPVIATRWAGSLKGGGKKQKNKLQLVMVANDGYLEGKTNFAVRVARCALVAAAEAEKQATAADLAGARAAFKKFKRSAVPSAASGPQDNNNDGEGGDGDGIGSASLSERIRSPEDGGGAQGKDTATICIPDILREYAARAPGLTEELGADFARGHAHASGGVVSSPAFERLWAAMCAPPPSSGAEGGQGGDPATPAAANGNPSSGKKRDGRAEGRVEKAKTSQSTLEGFWTNRK